MEFKIVLDLKPCFDVLFPENQILINVSPNKAIYPNRVFVADATLNGTHRLPLTNYVLLSHGQRKL
ncbi:hypothetical protein T190_16900 [Sinorhizobium meliloti CCBAU 01290]|nr:hypothetical protein T190_16900 [Sinorhizobium meliloti CCBAU 01290]